MNTACRAFRRLLEGKLSGRSSATDLSQLAWHDHLLACGECRRMLEAEEALEDLLATLPNPRLSPRVTARVLARLRATQEPAIEAALFDARLDARLEALLDRDLGVVAPAGLAQRVLEGLDEERRLARAVSPRTTSSPVPFDAPLDALLDAEPAVTAPKDLAQRIQRGLAAERAASADARLDRVLDRAVVSAPAGMAQRVIAALESERGLERVRAPRFALVRTRWVYAAAATILAVLVAWLVWPKRAPRNANELANGPAHVEKTTDSTEPRTSPGAMPEDQMLAALPVLENWDRLEQLDVLLSTLDSADEATLDFQDAELAPPPPPSPGPEPKAPEPTPAPRSKG